MKDKRLDILLEHFEQTRDCQYFFLDQCIGYCKKIMEGDFPKQVDCSGELIDCKLEE